MATVVALFLPLLFTFASSSQCGILSNEIVFGYNTTILLNDAWTNCYGGPYSEPTTSAHLTAKCPILDDYYVFVGATYNSSEMATLGAFAPASVLLSESSNASVAFKPSYPDGDSNYSVFWYNVPGYSFGFSSIHQIMLDPGDKAVWNSKSRLSWNLDESGGFRAGTVITTSDLWHKVILYKYCQSVASPTGHLYLFSQSVCL